MKPLLWILQSAFGCRHGQMSRVFTIEKRTYRVCFKCGKEFGYSWASFPYDRVLPSTPMRHSITWNKPKSPRFEPIGAHAQ